MWPFRRRKRFKDLPWSGEGALSRRSYPDYASYVAHQAAKLAVTKNIEGHEREFREVLRARLPAVRGRALCLGARLGAEVRAFRDAGIPAVGIDLNPGPRNPDVLRGDFHRLPFRAGAFGAVYTNSLDHVLDLDRICGEASRVLTAEGTFVVEAVEGADEGRGPGSYESFFWRRVDDLVDAIASLGWRAGPRVAFTRPWAGRQVLFSKA
ncbi:MAG: class I SAM-dependent methyltransferase [Candidatus Brocadiae bacterium]|nr:class I SAM-dependent methyltransferase [Candidatus Brocadiia bacterium]